MEQRAGLAAVVALVPGEGGDPAPVGGEAVDGVRERLRREGELEVIGREENLVRLGIDRHVATGGAAIVAGNGGTGARGSGGVGPLQLIRTPAEGVHQLPGRAEAAQLGFQLGEGVLKEVGTVGGGGGSGHADPEPSQEHGE